jgi:NADH dehydrogenase [ubiquinone] 1 alpha subcomplex assembly factor 7
LSVHSPISAEIRKLIRSAGPMPVSRYMDICLTHPEHGYYRTRDPLGREGDFITAPEVSQMFGELLGLWAASVWQSMGSPPKIHFVELGPGRGTMMADMLRAIRVLPQFYQAVTVHLVEINPALIERQKDTLSGTNTKAQWHATLSDVPQGPAIILANEYFDALPINQMVRRTGGWHERVVDLDKNSQFVFSIAEEPQKHFEVLLPPLVRAAPVGAIFEWRSNNDIMQIGRRLRDFGGAALIVDYGHTRSDAGDTFQAIAKHSFADPLRNPGNADLTAHVDFEALALGAADVGALAHGPVEQGTFLKRLGIERRAAGLIAKSSIPVTAEVTAAIKRLVGTGRGGMGSLFKVLGISDPALTFLPGFSDEPPAQTAPVTPVGNNAAVPEDEVDHDD